MTLTITPGYDFGLNEVPTASTWGKQGSDVLLQDIPLSSVDSDLGTVGLQGSSSPSNLPNEGSMWVDHQTNIWGRTRWGALKIRHYGGMIETNRWAIYNLTSTIGRGDWMELVDNGSSCTTGSCSQAQKSGVDGTPNIFISQDTVASGTNGVYVRMATGPGYGFSAHFKRNPSGIGRKERFDNTSPSAQWPTLTGYDARPAEGLRGDILAEQTNEVHGGTSATSSTAYIYGGMIGGRLEIT
jgi:hypothetical protein